VAPGVARRDCVPQSGGAYGFNALPWLLPVGPVPQTRAQEVGLLVVALLAVASHVGLPPNLVLMDRTLSLFVPNTLTPLSYVFSLTRFLLCLVSPPPVIDFFLRALGLLQTNKFQPFGRAAASCASCSHELPATLSLQERWAGFCE